MRWLHPLLWSVVLIWLLAPDDRSRSHRLIVLAAYAVVILIAAWHPARRWCSRRLQPALALIDLAAVNLLVLVLLCEVAFWVLAATTSSPLFAMEDVGAAERIRHQRYRPHGFHNGHRCNSLGFVDEPFEIPRRAGTRRVVALGDSFSIAVVPYAQNYLTLLDEALDAHVDTEVLNFGVTSIGPAEYLHLWRTEARHYEPDLVLVCFFVGNDFVEYKRRSVLHPQSLRAFAVPQRLWRIATAHADFGDAADHGVMDPDAPTFGPEEFLRIETIRVAICRRSTDARISTRYRHTFALLRTLHQEIGSRLRVVVIPDEFQIDDELWASLTREAPHDFDRERPNRELSAFLATLGVPVLDLLPAIRAAAQTGPTYKLRDGHWNQRGNAAAAQAISRWLADEPGQPSPTRR